jgi:hypothetical protein
MTAAIRIITLAAGKPYYVFAATTAATTSITTRLN